MHSSNLKIIKAILAILVITVVLNMIGSIKVLKNNYYWRKEFFQLQMDYLKTRMDFIKYSNSGKMNWLAFFENKNTVINNGEKAQSVPILLYHGIITDPDWKPDEVNTALADFQNQLFALKQSGWQTITIEDYLAFSQGKKELPAKSFLLTFDDGRKDSFYPVDPILRTLNYSAVMFVITGRSLGLDNEKSPFHLSQIELAHMAKSGRWEMESHTQNSHNDEIIGPNGETGHSLSNKLWLAKEQRLETESEYKIRVSNDLTSARKNLENNFGGKALAFAYPFGDFGQAYVNFPGSKDILSDIVNSIYSASFYQASNSDFPLDYPTNSSLVKRIDISSPMNDQELLNMLNNNQEKTLPYADNFSRNNGWLKGWGIINFSENSMTISDSAEDDSAMTFLGGSYLWKDYYARTEVKIFNKTAFAMTARFQNESNFASCEFSDNYISLTQTINKNEKADINTAVNTNLSGGRPAQIGIAVFGNQVSCFLDGQKIVSGELDKRLNHGGVGFKIWDTGQKGATLMINDLKISNENIK